MTIYESMLSAYRDSSGTATPNAEQEVCQKITLAGLYRGGFFDHAAFYGGTCLRLFHGLPRFSEDMDFSLLEKRDDIHLENYFDAIREEFKIAGFDIEITKKEKKSFGRVESAFLKENTEAYDIKFQTRKTVKVKIELDTDPPLLFNTEQKLMLMPHSFMTRCFTLPDLFAGKMHALVYRTWQRRIKGRDWYDFEWYVRNGVPLDFVHLQARIKEFNGEDVCREQFMEQLRTKLATSDISNVKQDVLPYISNKQHGELTIWSNDYFMQLANMIKFE
ncbi:MAG: nucleotidyl transferase AbiEii/AbiGii toxin family protein [Bacteroidales bacterium]|nr:nucleotidyl transferase AbiEii/AbiGii toxin family protein [Bacteroidales bacterium]MCQ2205135.1 nucleotidyl transferase AbiEii/AbiGii toxin family protein [Bacteroidales bacterium]